MRAESLKEGDALLFIRRGRQRGEDERAVFAVEDARVVRDVAQAARLVRGPLRGIGSHDQLLVMLAEEDGQRRLADERGQSLARVQEGVEAAHVRGGGVVLIAAAGGLIVEHVAAQDGSLKAEAAAVCIRPAGR